MWKSSSKYGDKRCKVRCIDLPQAKMNRDLLTSPFVDVETTRFLTRSYSDLRSEECSSIYHRSISSKICSSFLSIRRYADLKIGLFNFRSIGNTKLTKLYLWPLEMIFSFPVPIQGGGLQRADSAFELLASWLSSIYAPIPRLSGH